MEPKKYKVKQNVLHEKLVKLGFFESSNCFRIKKALYKEFIYLIFTIDKDDYFGSTQVIDKEGITYAPFYDPSVRHNNDVADTIIKNYNKFMDSLVKRNILVPNNETIKNSNKYKSIKIKYFTDKIEKLRYIDGKSDWIDLRAAEDITLKAGEFKLIPLGVAMELPKGYEAHVVPRSSTFKNFGVLQTNSMGVIDETYCGDNDQWFFPALAMRDTQIKVNDRICQFRIMKHQPQIDFEETERLKNSDRGGHGSTGRY